MNELNIYKLFHDIFEYSKIIEGRFSVAVNYGHDLSQERVGEYIVEKLQPKKYPLVALFPPVDFPRGKFTEYKMKMVFALQQGEGTTGIKDALQNNTTGHPIIFDWKDMRECALNFFDALGKVSSKPPRKFFAELDMVERFSYSGTSNLSGVMVNFSLKVMENPFDDCFRNEEYSQVDEDVLRSVLTEKIHPQHLH